MHVKTLLVVSMKSSIESRRVVVTVVITFWNTALPSSHTTKQCRYQPGSSKPCEELPRCFHAALWIPVIRLCPVQWSSCTLLTRVLGALQSSARESPGLRYLTVLPQTSFCSPCYSDMEKISQKHVPSPLFVFCEQRANDPSLMGMLIPVYIML